MSTHMNTAALATVDVSIVVIGKNEGERLVRCLNSVREADWGDLRHELIYVDSQSSDASVATAQTLGARALVLDDAAPCAAKARNLGWQQASGQYILFLDGDTVLHPQFVQRALQCLSAAPQVCAAWGHRRESRPEQSLYTRVLDLDWVYPTGQTLYFGGDVLVRRQTLQDVGGFDPSLKAGEEPELCARLRSAGWRIEHIDAPMTTHDLAISHWRPYWLRAWRSGIAYAEVAERMRMRGDILWQHEAARDFRHGLLYTASPLLLIAAWWVSPLLTGLMVLAAAALIARTARRCAWKAPGQPLLQWQYAVHAHLQKVPAFFGQLKWRQAQRAQRDIGLVDYKQAADEPVFSAKRLLADGLTPLARLWHRVGIDRWLRLWSLARLQARTGTRIDASNVVLGPVEVHGSGNIELGKNALIYPGCYLETQGAGRIEIGNGVVLSRGVHIVAFEHVRIGDGAMVGEYSSLRDANHRVGTPALRDSGHVSAAISVGANVWIGRGACVLKGVQIGEHAVVAANAVVNRNVVATDLVAGVPARSLRSTPNTSTHTAA